VLRPENFKGTAALSQAGCQQGFTVNYSAYVNQATQAYYADSTVSASQVEDEEIDAIIRKQEQECYEATMKLQLMESQHVSSQPPQSAEAQKEESLVKRIGKNISQREATVKSEPAVDATRMPFEKILKLLLSSLNGSFVSDIPRQKCASPVPFNTTLGAYHPMFYVSKKRKLAKQDETFDGIPVRYQGFTKSTIWFSKENPRYGIVARRMQHQSRMKQKNATDKNIASKAAIFFHVFEGFSYVLIERSSPDEELNKQNLAAYVVESAAKFVQVWPIRKGVPSSHSASSVDEFNCNTTKKKMENSKIKFERSQSAPSLVNSLDPNGVSPLMASLVAPSTLMNRKSLPAKQKGLGKSKHSSAGETGDKKRRLDEYTTGVEVLPETKRQHSNDDLFSLADPDYDFFYNTDSKLEFDCDSLLEEALLTDDQDFESKTSLDDTDGSMDIFAQHCDLGIAASSDPNGVVLADQIFKTFCDCMEPTVFAREYESISSLLFSPAFARTLRIAVEGKDPRIEKEFLLPSSAGFVDGAPIACMYSMEGTNQQNPSDLCVLSCDANAKKILGLDPVGEANLLERMDKSKVASIMAKYHSLGKTSTESWSQKIITQRSGKKILVRCHSQEGVSSTGQKNRFSEIPRHLLLVS